jgi:hypothetical protein
MIRPPIKDKEAAYEHGNTFFIDLQAEPEMEGYYAYENNGGPCRGQYKHESAEYALSGL